MILVSWAAVPLWEFGQNPTIELYPSQVLDLMVRRLAKFDEVAWGYGRQ
jgi:hypothetical protein